MTLTFTVVRQVPWFGVVFMIHAAGKQSEPATNE